MDQTNNENALRDDRYTRLVAYVLGELDTSERAAVEAELSKSPDARAELERIQQTLGVVQTALKSMPTPRLVEPVRPPVPVPAGRPWWQGKGLAAAASVTALVGAATWLYYQPSSGGVLPQAEVSYSEKLLEEPAASKQNAGVDALSAKDQDPMGLLATAPAVNAKPTGSVTQLGLAVERGATGADASHAAPSTTADAGDVKLKKRARTEAPASAAPAPATGGASLRYGSRAGGGKAGAPKQAPGAPVAGGGASAGPSSAGPAGAASARPKSERASVELREELGRKSQDRQDADGRTSGGLPGLVAAEDRAGEGSTIVDGEAAPRTWMQMTPEERTALVEAEFDRLRGGCLPMPQELPRDMYFRFWGDNAFEATYLDRQSTFGVDVDTASYALARRYVTEGKLPQKAQIRTEEFVNYFKSDVPPPMAGPFAMHMDLAPSRFSDDPSRQMLRVVVRAKDLSVFDRKPLRLTFVIDVSGSMREQNRLETVKDALRLLVGQLGAGDQVAIIKFSAEAAQVVPMTSATEKLAFEQAIQPLQPEGGTNSNAGLQLGYATAIAGYDAACVNRVVFLSDGVPTAGETDINKIIAGVQPLKEKGIYLNTVGVGMNNHNDTLLEQLADKGDGICNYIDSPKEAKRALVDNFTGAFQPVGRDVKVQVEFDPQQVLRWRQIGYENRAIADADFRNDTVDAGEIGAGHQVTALYELELARTDRAEPLAVVRLRWKDPVKSTNKADGDKAQEVEAVVHAAARTGFEAAGQGYRRAVMVAQYAEFLRRSTHVMNDRVDDLLEEAKRLQQETPQDAEWNEFVSLVDKAKTLGLGAPEACDELCTLEAQLRRVHWRRYERERLKEAGHPHAADVYDADITKLEAELRQLVERRFAEQK